MRTPEWSLPLHLNKHIVSVQPTNSFLRTSPKKVNYKPAGGKWKYPADSWASNQPAIQNPTVAQVCNTSGVTPLCLRTLYNTVNYKPQVPGKNKVALNNFLGETNNRSDVEIFLEKYRPDAAEFKFDISVINGGDNQQTPNTPAQNAAGKDLEGNLDAETIIGIDYPTPFIAYNTGGEPPFNPDMNRTWFGLTTFSRNRTSPKQSAPRTPTTNRPSPYPMLQPYASNLHNSGPAESPFCSPPGTAGWEPTRTASAMTARTARPSYLNFRPHAPT